MEDKETIDPVIPSKPLTISLTPYGNLPLDIITEILTRLPVKTLVRFKCVSKSWLNMISNSYFVKTHLVKSSKAQDYANYRLIFRELWGRALKSCSLHSVLNSKHDNAIDLELDYPLDSKTHRRVLIQGSCNGLLCITIERGYLFLWNPSTRKSKRLPDSGIAEPHKHIITYGFGFDEHSDDYKVVGIFYRYINDGKSSSGTIVNVYSSRTDAWRRIGDFPHNSWLKVPGKFANGTLHWALRGDVNSDFSWKIVSLDLATETYGEIAQPCYGHTIVDAANLTLGVLEGCICVLFSHQRSHADLWVMKEYGVRSSWTKLTTMSSMAISLNNYDSSPMWISSTGEILWIIWGNFAPNYNPDAAGLLLCSTNGTRSEIHNMCKIRQIFAYVESLVSPEFGKSTIGRHGWIQNVKPVEEKRTNIF